MNEKVNVANAIFEMFEATRTPRSGWQRFGVKEGNENVAEHTCLVAQIAYILALMEGIDFPEKAACMALFHDSAEARTGDANRVNTRYFKKAAGERIAFNDFVANLPADVGSIIASHFHEYENKVSEHALMVKDADLLQMAFQAKYLISIGYRFAQHFIDGVNGSLRTDSAKEIFAQLQETDFHEWSL